MRVIFFGHALYSVPLLIRLAALPGVEVTGVVTRRAAPMNADFASLIPLAEQHLGVACLVAEEVPEQAWASWLRARQPDVGYAFGWSTLLKRDVLDAFPSGIIGYHPAPLPRNRGHHPIIWALALGLEETASTLFMLDEGVDSGDIVSQRRVPIAPEDDVGTLYEKLTAIVGEQIDDVTAGLVRGDLRRVPQDHSKRSIWRKRGQADGRIDWRMSAASIHNLVRALTRPYVGAHCVVDGRDVKVWRTRPAGPADGWRDLEPGRVIKTMDRRFVVKCGEGAVEILEHELEAAPRAGMCLL
jgi:methionyl-tRNA formyltransferase